MKKVLALLLCAIITTPSFSAVANIEEEDGSPSVFPWKLKFTNGAVTDNGDGTASIDVTAGSSTETDPTLTDDNAVTIGDGVTADPVLNFNGATGSDGSIRWDETGVNNFVFDGYISMADVTGTKYLEFDSTKFINGGNAGEMALVVDSKNIILIDDNSIVGKDEILINAGQYDYDTIISGDTKDPLIFVDAGSDTVTVGNEVSLALLAVDGFSDEIQFVVQGHSTQTSNLVVFENSGGTDLFAMTNAGALTLSGYDCSGNANGGALTADASGNITCTDDDSGAGSGDSVTVNSSAVDTTANFLDNADIAWTLTDGGAGGPDDITGAINWSNASNLAVSNFAASAIVIESETITLNDNDTTIPTSAAVKNYADAETATLTNKTINTASNTITIVEADISDLAHTVDTTLSQEQVEDYAGAMAAGNTETLITVTYQDADGTMDYEVTSTLSSYTNDAGFLTAEVDGSTTNELQNLFETISTTSGTSPVADSNTDTLTISAGTGITVTGDSATDTITIASTITDTNANTICSGTTTYLDGEGNCDDISSVYEPAGITESDISDLDHTATDITADIVDFNDIKQDNTLLGNPALLVDECYFVATTSGGGFICEGSTADTNEQLYLFPDVNGADTTQEITVNDATQTLTNKTINTASNTITIVEADISDLSHTVDTTLYSTDGTISDNRVATSAGKFTIVANDGTKVPLVVKANASHGSNTPIFAITDSSDNYMTVVKGNGTLSASSTSTRALHTISTDSQIRADNYTNTAISGAGMVTNRYRGSIGSASDVQTNDEVFIIDSYARINSTESSASKIFTTVSDTTGSQIDTAMSFQTAENNTLATALKLDFNQSIDFPDYGSGNNTGTDTYLLAVDSSGNLIEKSSKIEVQMVVFGFTTNLSTGDGAFYFRIGNKIGSANLVGVHAEVITAGTTNTTDIQIYNVDNALDMLSTKLTIDSAETGSDTAATAAVINTSNDHVDLHDVLRIDIDQVSTTPPQGLIVTLEFQTR